jgi:formylglycine-generating enzyme required for sulfatase activity
VRDLYHRLSREGFIQPWLDEEELLPGQDGDTEIRKAVQASDVVLVCLSPQSITKADYVQKEIKFALDIADEQWENGKIPSGQENHPAVDVSWDDATAFCQWLSRESGRSYHLPTEAEWEKAARGTDGRKYIDCPRGQSMG